MALVPGADHQVAPGEVQLRTVTDVVALSGGAANLIGGARIIIDPNDPLVVAASSPEQLRRAFLKAPGLPPRAHYVEREGVLWPADFHSWNLVTAYWAIERAQTYFEVSGGPSLEQLGPADYFYFPEFVLKDVSAEPLVNNALFFSPVRGTLLLPFDEDLQKVPLALNAGVLAHEYAHRIFNHRVHDGALFPEIVGRLSGPGSTSAAAKILYALEEGLADYHAVSVSCAEPTGCAPDFLQASFEESFSAPRDISRRDLCVSASLLNALSSQTVAEFRANSLDYRLGSIIASVLFQAAESTGLREDLNRAILAAYSDASGEAPGFRQLLLEHSSSDQNLTLGMFLNSIIRHAEAPALQTALCTEAMDHLRIGREQLPACVGAPGASECPPLTEGG